MRKKTSPFFCQHLVKVTSIDHFFSKAVKKAKFICPVTKTNANVSNFFKTFFKAKLQLSKKQTEDSFCSLWKSHCQFRVENLELRFKVNKQNKTDEKNSYNKVPRNARFIPF